MLLAALLPAAAASEVRNVADTALGLACNRGHEGVAEVLLSHGASPDQPICEAGATPLMIAVLWDRVAMVQLLLRHGAALGAPISCRTAGPYGDGDAIELARTRDRKECLRLLLSARASRRLARLRRAVPLAGRFLLALQELYAQVHYRPDGEGARRACLEFYAAAARMSALPPSPAPRACPLTACEEASGAERRPRDEYRVLSRATFCPAGLMQLVITVTSR